MTDVGASRTSRSFGFGYSGIFVARASRPCRATQLNWKSACPEALRLQARARHPRYSNSVLLKFAVQIPFLALRDAEDPEPLAGRVFDVEVIARFVMPLPPLPRDALG